MGGVLISQSRGKGWEGRAGGSEAAVGFTRIFLSYFILHIYRAVVVFIPASFQHYSIPNSCTYVTILYRLLLPPVTKHGYRVPR